MHLQWACQGKNAVISIQEPDWTPEIGDDRRHLPTSRVETRRRRAPRLKAGPSFVVPSCSMATVTELLDKKGHNVESISPDATVFDAIKRMADLDIGALVVMDAGKVIGLITERDYARNVILRGKSSPKTSVRDVMEKDVLFVGRADTARDCMAIMTGKRSRHLLVMEGGELIGILSIGDLVRSIVAEQDMTIEQLEQYIHRG